jgi:hypothetical protein
MSAGTPRLEIIPDIQAHSPDHLISPHNLLRQLLDASA